MEWLTDLSKPANFVMIYVEEPDYYSHIYGPDSDVVHERIKILDKLSQYLDVSCKYFNFLFRKFTQSILGSIIQA